MAEITLTLTKEELERLVTGAWLYYQECKGSNTWPAPVEELHREKAYAVYLKIKNKLVEVDNPNPKGDGE